MKWNIDHELSKAAALLGNDGLGITVKRVVLAHSLFPKFRLTIPKGNTVHASQVWTINIPSESSFIVVCGVTLHEASINLRRLLREKGLMKIRRRAEVQGPRPRVQDSLEK